VRFRELSSHTATGEKSEVIRERVVARTLADLAGAAEIRPSDILEAIPYRSLDRKLLS